jgi:hypothetical protein
MRSLLIPGLILGFATMACAAAPRPGEQARVATETTSEGAAPASSNDSPRRLDTAEIRALIVGSVVTPMRNGRPSPLDGVYQERFYSVATMDPPALDYLVRSDAQTDGGSYSIEADLLCIRMARRPERHCRAVFQLGRGGYAFSRVGELDVVASEIRVRRRVI